VPPQTPPPPLTNHTPNPNVWVAAWNGFLGQFGF
jgi:hypothetical protein